MRLNEKLKAMLESNDFSMQGIRHGTHWIVWLTFLFIVLGLIWAYFSIIDEVTVAQGKVIPSKQTQVIQNLEGGIVKDILVSKGQLVDQGQILAYLDTTRFASEYNENKQKEISLQLKISRLTAELKKEPFVAPADIQKSNPDAVFSEDMLYQARKHSLETLTTQYNLTSKELELTRPLVKQGAASPVELLHLQQSLADIDSKISNYKSAALDELNKAKADLSALNQATTAAQDRLTRTTIHSPVKGIVNQIFVHTIGGVIKPGDDLMEIVPMDDTLLVQARVKPADVGFIHTGQAATVKITAYDFSIYGGLTGTVERISADTIKDPDPTKADEKNENYYEIWVRTNQNYIQIKDRPKLYIIPGMTASVDILTGHKTILDYLLKPILKTKQTALHER